MSWWGRRHGEMAKYFLRSLTETAVGNVKCFCVTEDECRGGKKRRKKKKKGALSCWILAI